jgi:hypothetical protein
MIRKIMLLAPGKYDELVERFNEIQKAIDRILTEKKPLKDDRLVLPLNQINKDMADIVGGKMANLGEIRNAVGLKVPPGFVITSAAYQRLFDHNDLRAEINRRLQTADLEDIQQLYTLQASMNRLIVEAEVPPDLVQAILEAWQVTEEEAGFEITAALRSSALGEDETGSSFAGMHRSELNISADNVIQSYKEIVASKYSLQAMTYRLKKGFKDEDIAMCVGCLVMVDARSGGVMYSRNPIDIHDDAIFINSAWGLPKAVVDGTIDCDLFVVARQAPLQVIHQDVKDKDRKFVCYPLEGVCRIDLTVDDTRRQPSLSDEQAIALAEMAVRLEAHYGTPLDIEWAVGHENEIYVLQCRPLQQVETPMRSMPQMPRAHQRRGHRQPRCRGRTGPSTGTRHRHAGVPGRRHHGCPGGAAALGLPHQPGGRGRHRTRQLCRPFGQRGPRVRRARAFRDCRCHEPDRKRGPGHSRCDRTDDLPRSRRSSPDNDGQKTGVDGGQPGLRNPAAGERAYRALEPIGSGRSGICAQELPDPARHHPFHPREIRAGDVQFRQGAQLC